MPSIVTVPDKVGPVLKRIADNSQEDFQAIEAVLKAANALLEENNLLLKEVGAAGEGVTNAGTFVRLRRCTLVGAFRIV